MDRVEYSLEIVCENAAFGESVMERGAEITRILREAADRIENGSLGGSLYDYNGNRVGDHGINCWAECYEQS